MYLYIYLSKNFVSTCTHSQKKKNERREKKNLISISREKNTAFWDQPDLIADNVGDLGTSSAPCHCEVLCTEGKVVPEDRSSQHKN